MHDTTNTLDGQYGFVVLFHDGRRISEREVVWDEVERSAPIAALALYDFKNDVQLLELTGYEKFYFANEAVSAQAMQASKGELVRSVKDRPVLAGKILGGLNGQRAVEVRVDLLGPKPKASKRELPTMFLPYSPATFRPGIVVR